MTLSPSKSVWSLAVATLAVISAASSSAQEAVLQLSILQSGGGSIESSAPSTSCTSTCSATVGLGGTVTLTASPAPGKAFESWAGDCFGSQPSCTLVMGGTKLAIASFKPAGDAFTVVHRFLPDYSDGWYPYSDLLAYGGHLYGMTDYGGHAGGGTIFREMPDGSQHTILHDFVGGPSDGGWPRGSLVELGGVLYGMTSSGGSGGCNGPDGPVNGCGTIFRINPDGGGFAILHSFAAGASDALGPTGSLTVSSGVLYGLTSSGGASDTGTIFRISPDGSGFALLHSFGGTPPGAWPSGTLACSGDTLYGVTEYGGANNVGSIFRVNTDGSGFEVIHSFVPGPDEGYYPMGSLTGYAGMLYGMTTSGGEGGGSIFRVNPDGSGFELLHSFAIGGPEGGEPFGAVTAIEGVLFGMTQLGGVGRGAVFKLNPDGSEFTLLHSFLGGDGDGSQPLGSLIPCGSALCGTTYAGGTDDVGTVFEVTPSGSGFTLLHSFVRSARSGLNPSGSLGLLNGVLYGMTNAGGSANAGTIFKVDPDGSAFTLLHSFVGAPSEGKWPWGCSPLATGSDLFGMTSAGGANDDGSVFRVNLDGGDFALLHSFTDELTEGSWPSGSLVASAGALFGMAGSDGICAGSIFRVNPDSNVFSVLHSFTCGTSDGGAPFGSLLESGGALYGMTRNGGPSRGTIFTIRPDGSGFALLHSFAGGESDGAAPHDSLIATGEELYGMTTYGGATELGTVFKLGVDGSGFTLLHTFAGGTTDGSRPYGSLVELAGTLYGMTSEGGAHGHGTIFKVDTDGTNYGVLRSFDGVDGADPGQGSSLTAIDGRLYGMTWNGGLADGGVLFRLVVQPGPGDANGDLRVDVQDVFYLINYLFAGGPAPVGPSDVNGDTVVNVADVFYLIDYLFAGGPAPV